MKTPAILIALIMVALPFPAAACEPTSDQMTDYFVRARQQEEAYVADLGARADQIFTGVVVDVTDLPDGPYVQLAHVKVEKMLKGDPVAVATAKMQLRESKSDWATLDRIPSCGDLPDPAQDKPYVVKTYRHLYYVKDGVLLRASGFPLGPPPLEPKDEMELLQERVPGIRR